jgi:hypothetical protein
VKAPLRHVAPIRDGSSHVITPNSKFILKDEDIAQRILFIFLDKLKPNTCSTRSAG